jgi:HEAT repeat protein
MYSTNRRAGIGLFLVLACLGIWGNPQRLRAQAGPNDPVEKLRIALLQTTDDVQLRERGLREAVENLRGIGDLRRAVALKEWKDRSLESGLAAVDRSQRKVVAERFLAATRELLRRKEPSTVNLALDMIVELATEARDNNDNLGLTRNLTPDVIALVESEDPYLRLPAARALGLIDPEPVTATPVLSQLLEAHDPSLRRSATEGLANMLQMTVNVVGPTRQATRPPGARREAVVTANTILAALKPGFADAQAEVRRRCITAAQRAAAELQQIVTEAPAQDDNDAERRFRRTTLEEERGDLRPLLLGLRDQLPHFADAVKDDDVDTRIAALSALEALARIRWKWVRQGIWLGGPPRGEAPPLVDDPLGNGLQTVLPALAKALTDGEVKVRRVALDVLDVYGPEAAPAAPAVALVLTDGDRFVRWAAVRTLKEIGAPGALPAIPSLAKLLEDTDADVGKAAIDALVHLDPLGEGVPPRGKKPPKNAEKRNAVPALAHAVKAHDADMRLAALAALKGMGENARPAIPALSGALGDPEPRVRQAAAAALGDLGPVARDAVPDLNLALKDSDPNVRRAASDALLRITRALEP